MLYVWHGVNLYCEKLEMSVKADHNIYLDQMMEKYNVTCSLSSKYCFCLLPDMALTIPYSHGAF